MRWTTQIDSTTRYRQTQTAAALLATASITVMAGGAQAGTDFSIAFTTETAVVDIQSFGPGTADDLDVQIFNFFAGDGLSGEIGGTPLSTNIPVAFTDDIPGVGSVSLQNSSVNVTSGPGSQSGDIGDTFVSALDLSGATQAGEGSASVNGFLLSETAFQIVNTSPDTAFRLTFEVRTEGSVEISVDDPGLDSVVLEPIITGPTTANGPSSANARLNPLIFDSALSPGGDLVETFDITNLLVVDLLPSTANFELPTELLALVPDNFSGSDFLFFANTTADLEFAAVSQAAATSSTSGATSVPSPTAAAGILGLILMAVRRRRRVA